MWLITKIGFFSVVQKRQDAASGMLTIRSRVRGDLESLNKIMTGLGPIQEGKGTDYRYRARASKQDVAATFSGMIAELDYQNFKDEVKATQGKPRAEIYGDVWQVLYGLTADANPKPKVAVTKSKALAPRA